MSLQLLLRANAVSCLAFGFLFFATPDAVSQFLSDNPVQPWVFLGLGALLITNGILLVITSALPHPNRAFILFFSAGDFAWVLGTIALIAAGVAVTTPQGISAALIVAVLVGGLGAGQLLANKRMKHAEV